MIHTFLFSASFRNSFKDIFLLVKWSDTLFVFGIFPWDIAINSRFEFMYKP